ncbi:putative RNA-directed DNA polymerase [Helianthus annuus]|nr:putative RNA-directed DNA polymerase [Helianthus annuus]
MMQINNPDTSWNMDTGASSHITSNIGKISTPLSFSSSTILVGNGHKLPITGSGNSLHTVSTKTYQLNNVLHSPTVIKDLLSVRKFTRDNQVSIEFDPFGFSLKDLKTGTFLSRHDSTGDLYPLTPPSFALASVSQPTPWHNRLGHPGATILNFLSSHNFIHCNKTTSQSICSSCQIANSQRLPFNDSKSITFAPFDIVHCDLWTSPVLSKSGYKYYMVLIDNFTQHVWVYPLKFKSETFPTFAKFHKLIHTQFNRLIKTFQCDLGGEFDNHSFKQFAAQQGMVLRFSCPQTSPQNGKAERMLRRLNNIIRAILTHARLPPTFWVEALHTATYLHNILPTPKLNHHTPAFALYQRHPTYDHLRVFGCACYPNASATQPHKLSPRSTRCIFLGYPPNFRGYRCMDPLTGRVHISRHVFLTSTTFPPTSPPRPTLITSSMMKPTLSSLRYPQPHRTHLSAQTNPSPTSLPLPSPLLSAQTNPSPTRLPLPSPLLTQPHLNRIHQITHRLLPQRPNPLPTVTTCILDPRLESPSLIQNLILLLLPSTITSHPFPHPTSKPF